jgi:hypothetical protein
MLYECDDAGGVLLPPCVSVSPLSQVAKEGGVAHVARLLPMTRPQVPCVSQKGSKELDLRKWLETWCHSQLPALKGVEGSCWKLWD